MYCQYPKKSSPRTHLPKREHEAPTSPRNTSPVSKCSQMKLFQKIWKTLTCPLLWFSRHVTQIPTSRRHLPQGSACAGPRTSLLCLSQRLAACFLQLICSDKDKFRLWGLRFLTQHTPPTLEAWLHLKTNKTFLRNKQFAQSHPEQKKLCQYSIK